MTFLVWLSCTIIIKKTLNDLHNNARVKEINDKFKAIFNYDSHREKIRRFLSESNNGFEIHNCVYCDLNKVKGYTRADGKRNLEFHADHVLDKGLCPLVALSIHNFVPSCPTCNEPPLKGVKPLGNTKADTLKISPKSATNKFETEVKFILNITDITIPDLELFKTNDGWEIDFSYKDGVYQQTVSMFDLKERYNAEKGYFGEYLQKKRIFNIKELAERYKCTDGEILEVLFCYERNKQEHTPKEKCRLELLEQVQPILLK